MARPYVVSQASATVVAPRTKLMILLPIIAAFVIVLVYLQLFTNPIVIAVVFVLWVAVSLRNKRKFKRQQMSE